MYCGQCGKRVLDDMLFCPFCGAPIVIPEQDEEKPVEVAVEEEPKVEESPKAEEATSEESASEEVQPEADSVAEDVVQEEEPSDSAQRPRSLFDEMDEAEENDRADASGDDKSAEAEDDDLFFAPLEIGEAPEPAPEEEATEPISHAPPRRPMPKLRSEAGSPPTFIPVKDVNPNDMFMVREHPDRDDDYDPFDDIASGGDGEFTFEEEPDGFLQRHIRGVVGVILLLALVLIFLIWAMLPRGQRVLASANLAWSAQVYYDLGYEAHDAGQYRLAADYFERALARDSDNYDYAHSAMVSYYEAEDIDSALSMLKRCIDMNPDSPEPYAELMILYPDAESRPWDVRQLLRQGYERTGEEALNVSGE